MDGWRGCKSRANREGRMRCRECMWMWCAEPGPRLAEPMLFNRSGGVVSSFHRYEATLLATGEILGWSTHDYLRG
jgi:hypothetical protein